MHIFYCVWSTPHNTFTEVGGHFPTNRNKVGETICAEEACGMEFLLKETFISPSMLSQQSLLHIKRIFAWATSFSSINFSSTLFYSRS